MKTTVTAICSAFWALLLLASASLQADESIGLQFPVEEARLAVTEGRFEFVAIDMPENLEMPGLTRAQMDVVREKYKVRSLNRRWNSYANIEDRPEELTRMRHYANRYNMALWDEIEKKKVRDMKKYRY